MQTFVDQKAKFKVYPLFVRKPVQFNCGTPSTAGDPSQIPPVLLYSGPDCLSYTTNQLTFLVCMGD